MRTLTQATTQARAKPLSLLAILAFAGTSLPVSGLAVEHESLQDSYLSRVASAKAGRLPTGDAS